MIFREVSARLFPQDHVDEGVDHSLDVQSGGEAGRATVHSAVAPEALARPTSPIGITPPATDRGDPGRTCCYPSK
jgi:hypothetical protein